jgi:arylsulfatase
MDRGSPVSHYTAPFRFTGELALVRITIEPDQDLDAEAAAQLEAARD